MIHAIGTNLSEENNALILRMLKALLDISEENLSIHDVKTEIPIIENEIVIAYGQAATRACKANNINIHLSLPNANALEKVDKNKQNRAKAVEKLKKFKTVIANLEKQTAENVAVEADVEAVTVTLKDDSQLKLGKTKDSHITFDELDLIKDFLQKLPHEGYEFELHRPDENNNN